MYKCPNCSKRTDVYDSRISHLGQVRRKRSCNSCGFRFATIEVLDGELPQAAEPRKEAAPEPTHLPKPKPKVVRGKRESKRRLDDEDFYEAPYPDDIRDVVRDLGIGGFD